MLADSRVKNLQKLQVTSFPVECMLLRMPMLSEAEEVIKIAQISLNSEISTIKALNHAAQKLRSRHKIILMIDVGDLREGVWPDKVRETVDEIVKCQHIHLEGIGTNLGCYGGIIPTPENMKLLLKQKEYIETRYSLKLSVVSGGSTCALQLLISGKMPKGINHFRIGEGILLGRSTTDRSVLPNTYQDAFLIRAEVIECNQKPSVPIGTRGLDAFGDVPEFEDKGIRQRAIVAIGRQDVVKTEGLLPFDRQVTILGATSDHLIVDITSSKRQYKIGDTMKFYPDYTSLLAAATSEYVAKEFAPC